MGTTSRLGREEKQMYMCMGRVHKAGTQSGSQCGAGETSKGSSQEVAVVVMRHKELQVYKSTGAKGLMDRSCETSGASSKAAGVAMRV